MSRSCNGKGCNGAWDCDNCHQTGDCEKAVICDDCGAECYEDYWEIDGQDLCSDCAENNYKRSVDF